MAIVATAFTVIAVAAIVIGTAGNSRAAPGPGCIRANVAMVMGAEELNLCGQRAKRTCAAHAGDPDPVSRTIEAECRDAGLLKPS